MSHVSKQIVDWIASALTGVGGLPTAQVGIPNQLASNLTACIVWPVSESIESQGFTNPKIQIRTLQIEVMLIARTLADAETFSVLAEEKLAVTAFTVGDNLQLVAREFTDNKETDRDYIMITLVYQATYIVSSADVEILG